MQAGSEPLVLMQGWRSHISSRQSCFNGKREAAKLDPKNHTKMDPVRLKSEFAASMTNRMNDSSAGVSARHMSKALVSGEDEARP